MGESDSSLQWKLAIVGLIGVILGTVLGSIGQYMVWYEQQKNEQRNIAQALYIEIFYVSDHVNYTLSSLDSGAIYYNPIPYYDEKGLYYTHQTEISRFDSDLTKDLYQYYQTVREIENKRQYIANHVENAIAKQKMSSMEKEYLADYTQMMHDQAHNSTRLANIVEKDLEEKYDMNINLTPTWSNRYPRHFNVSNITILYGREFRGYHEL